MDFVRNFQGSLNFIADGKTYLYEDSLVNVNITSFCRRGVLTTIIGLSIGDAFNIELKKELSLDKNSNLVIKGDDYENEFDIQVCKKIKTLANCFLIFKNQGF